MRSSIPTNCRRSARPCFDSLQEYNYYTTITDNGKTIKVNKPNEITADYKDGQLLLMFAVKPAEPIPLKGNMSFGVYDPTMYTAMDFPTDSDLVAVGDQLNACEHKVVRPRPG